MDNYTLKFKVPLKEFAICGKLLSELTESLDRQIELSNKHIHIRVPDNSDIVKTLVRYAYCEINKEFELKKNNQLKGWGLINLPEWMATNTAEPLLRAEISMNKNQHDKMLHQIAYLYPDIYNNNKISNDDFIGAFGIAYVHRILAGQVKIEVEVP